MADMAPILTKKTPNEVMLLEQSLSSSLEERQSTQDTIAQTLSKQTELMKQEKEQAAKDKIKKEREDRKEKRNQKLKDDFVKRREDLKDWAEKTTETTSQGLIETALGPLNLLIKPLEEAFNFDLAGALTGGLKNLFTVMRDPFQNSRASGQDSDPIKDNFPTAESEESFPQVVQEVESPEPVVIETQNETPLDIMPQPFEEIGAYGSGTPFEGNPENEDDVQALDPGSVYLGAKLEEAGIVGGLEGRSSEVGGLLDMFGGLGDGLGFGVASSLGKGLLPAIKGALGAIGPSLMTTLGVAGIPALLIGAIAAAGAVSDSLKEEKWSEEFGETAEEVDTDFYNVANLDQAFLALQAGFQDAKNYEDDLYDFEAALTQTADEMGLTLEQAVKIGLASEKVAGEYRSQLEVLNQQLQEQKQFDEVLASTTLPFNQAESVVTPEFLQGYAEAYDLSYLDAIDQAINSTSSAAIKDILLNIRLEEAGLPETTKYSGYSMGPRPTMSVDDAIITTDGQVIETHPDDTIFATKNELQVMEDINYTQDTQIERSIIDTRVHELLEELIEAVQTSKPAEQNNSFITLESRFSSSSLRKHLGAE